MRFILPSPLALVAATASPASAQAEAWWGHVTALADDSMRGRETGSPEHRKAAEYVAAARSNARASCPRERTAGSSRSASRSAGSNEAAPAWRWCEAARRSRSSFGQDATINLRTSSAGKVDAPARLHRLRGAARRSTGTTTSPGSTSRARSPWCWPAPRPEGFPAPHWPAGRAAGAEALRQGGAVGVAHHLSPPMRTSRGIATLSPGCIRRCGSRPIRRRAAGDSADHRRPESGEGGAALRRLLPQRYAAIQALADSGAPLPRFDLPVRLRATVAVDESEAVSDNVVGLLPGGDPALKREYVALTAHLDHLGVGQPVAGDSIYNGAMDNASGIATLIETAGRARRAEARPRRSVLFVAVTAEEKGLLGSDYFAGAPDGPAGRRPRGQSQHRHVPADQSAAAAAGERAGGVGPRRRRPPRRRAGRDRGDHRSRSRSATPSSAATSSASSAAGSRRCRSRWASRCGSPEHERVLRWRQERYHGVEDEVTQPVDRQAAEDFNRLYPEVVAEVANRAVAAGLVSHQRVPAGEHRRAIRE